MWEVLKDGDRELFLFLNSLGIEKYDSFWIVITQVYTWIPLLIFFVILLYSGYSDKNRIPVLFFFLICLAFTAGLTELVKNYVARLRPNNHSDFAELIRVLQTPSNYSFFSGHASFSFSATTYVVFSLKKKSKWVSVFYIWPVLFSLSRIYVGVHYPADIFAGMGVGAGAGFVFYLISQKTMKRKLIFDPGDTDSVSDRQ